MTIPNPRTRWPASFRAVLMAVCAWLCLATVAMAHASLTAVVPRDGTVVETVPERFSLSFSEPVSPLALTLVRPDGSAVALGNVVLRDRTLDIEPPAGLGTGTYVLSWRVISEDGHPVSGSTVFSVGAPSVTAPVVPDAVDGPVRSALWLAKLGLYAGFFFGIGGVFAVSVFLWDRSAARRTIGLMIALGLLCTVASAALQGLDALGAPLDRIADPQVWKAGFGTSFGNTVLLMVAALILAAAAHVSDKAWVSRVVSVVAVLAGALSLALSGHASAAEPQWLMRPSVFLHAAAIAIWIGALMPLGLALRAGTVTAGAALIRFSRFIPYAVVMLVAAGVVLAVVQVREPSALLTTAYGNLLIAKLVLVAILSLLAAINRWRLTRGAAAGEKPLQRHLARTIAAETLLVLLVFGVVAAWRFTPPPRALAIAAAQPASTHIHTAKAMAEVTVTPGRSGPVTVSAAIMTGDFGPLDAKEVTFVFSYPAAGIEPIRRKAVKPGDGTWRVTDLVLPVSGRWTVRLDILISDFEMTRIEGAVDLGS